LVVGVGEVVEERESEDDREVSSWEVKERATSEGQRVLGNVRWERRCWRRLRRRGAGGEDGGGVLVLVAVEEEEEDGEAEECLVRGGGLVGITLERERCVGEQFGSGEGDSGSKVEGGGC
jgi:hypothetical protein